MNLSDKSKVLTAEDLIRRYNLEGLRTIRKDVNNLNQVIKRQDNIIKNYIKNITPYKNQAKNTIKAWFFNGVPVIDEESKIEENDVLFDRDTGYIYQLIKINEDLVWQRIQDEELSESLNYANSDADTSDNKRTLFYEEPTTPYEVGDIWLKDNLIMRCRCTRPEGDINLVDWIVQDEYTEDYVLAETRAILNEFKTTVETDYSTTVQLEATKDSILSKVESETTKIEVKLNNDYYTKEELDNMQSSNIQNITEVKNSVENLTNSTSHTISILEEKINNGVTELKTENNYTFNKNGLNISDSNAPVGNNVNAYGVEVKDKTSQNEATQFYGGYVYEDLLNRAPKLEKYLGQTVTYAKNFLFEQYFSSEHWRIEEVFDEEEGIGLGLFYIGDD